MSSSEVCTTPVPLMHKAIHFYSFQLRKWDEIKSLLGNDNFYTKVALHKTKIC